MSETCEVIATVVSQKGTCVAGHKVGEAFPIGDKTPHGMCSWAFYTVFPSVITLQYNGSFPWELDPETAIVACPDPTNPVVFELRRKRK